MPTHVMLDLETLSTSHDAVILSIGAVKFDPYDDKVPFDAFYQAIDAESCEVTGLKISAATLRWWLDPAQDEARKKYMSERHVELFTALDGFSQWFGDDKPVWGNSCAFDNVILRHALSIVGLEPPWHFANDRCYRTMKNVYPAVPKPEPDIKHHALSDAVAQAKHLQAIFHHLGLAVG